MSYIDVLKYMWAYNTITQQKAEIRNTDFSYKRNRLQYDRLEVVHCPRIHNYSNSLTKSLTSIVLFFAIYCSYQMESATDCSSRQPDGICLTPRLMTRRWFFHYASNKYIYIGNHMQHRHYNLQKDYQIQSTSQYIVITIRFVRTQLKCFLCFYFTLNVSSLPSHSLMTFQQNCDDN